MQQLAPATLVLENGLIYIGQPFGAPVDVVFELVFNTSMTGYQEILSDPSYRGQGVLFTVPHIGNVEINPDDSEADRPQVSAVIIRSLSPVVSNWRANTDLSSWLQEYGVPGITGIDTRAITRKLRDVGTLRAALSNKGTSANNLLKMARAWPGLDGRDMVREVTCRESFEWVNNSADVKWVKKIDIRDESVPDLLIPENLVVREPCFKIVVIDFGAKRHILRHLASRGAVVTVVPADTSIETILSLLPDGVVLSNGPGDPAGLPYAIETITSLIEIGLPILGICLGHQLIGLALGGKTSRLKFGHHGGNHPVKNINTGKVYITAQNHNYMLLPESLNLNEVEVTHSSLNDGSVEGLRLRKRPVYCVQFHPESAPGPHDAHEIFGPFFDDMLERKNRLVDGKL